MSRPASSLAGAIWSLAATGAGLFSSQAVLVVLTYALLVSLTAGEYDLSAAPVLTMSLRV